MKKRKGYIFTNKRHSNRAVMSTILGTISLISLSAVVFLAYRDAGTARTGYGFTGLLAMLYSLAGLYLGVATVKDKKYYRLFPVLGVVLNLAVLGLVGLILYMGASG